MGSGYYSTITPGHIYVSQNELIPWGVSFTVNLGARLQLEVRLVSNVRSGVVRCTNCDKHLKSTEVEVQFCATGATPIMIPRYNRAQS
jgi:hypothetical protein